MSKKPLDKKGPASDIKYINEDWTALSNDFDYIIDLIKLSLNIKMSAIDGTDQPPLYER